MAIGGAAPPPPAVRRHHRAATVQGGCYYSDDGQSDESYYLLYVSRSSRSRPQYCSPQSTWTVRCKSKIMISVKYMADPRLIWQCLYYEDSPPVSLPKARSQDRDLRHPSPRRTRSTGGETSQTTSIGSSIHCIGPDTEYLQKLSHLFIYWSSFRKLDTIKFVKSLSEYFNDFCI